MDEPAMTDDLQRARELAADRKWLHAIQIYRRILQEHPGHDEVWVELAHTYASMNRVDAAERLLLDRAATASSPEPYLFLLGSLLYRVGRLPDAHRHLARVLRKESALDEHLRARLHYLLGAIFADGKKWSIAEYHFQKVLKLDEEYPRIHESLAEVLLHRNRLPDAESYLRRALEEEPYSWASHFLMGSVALRRKQWRAALEAYTFCVDIDPKDPRGWLKCGEALLHLKQLDESEKYLRKALELNPMLTDAIVMFGYLELERGDSKSAEECFDQVLAIDPGNRRAIAGSRSVRRSGKEGRS